MSQEETYLQLMKSLGQIDPLTQELVASGNPIQDFADPIMGGQGIPTTGISHGSPFKTEGGLEGSGVDPNVHPYPEHLQGVPTTGISHGSPYAEDDGSSFFGGIADFLSGDISPEAQAALDQEAGELDMMQNPEFNILPDDAFVDKAGTGYADPPQDVAPEKLDPSKVNPADVVSVGKAVAGQLENKAKATGKQFEQWYEQQENNEGFTPEKQEEVFSLVQQISNTLGATFTGAGNLLEMGYKGWMSLSPSTRTALVGAAATAWAYNKGWKETAGDTAQAFMGMYSQERQNEVAQEETEQARMAAQQAAELERANELTDAATEYGWKDKDREDDQAHQLELERLKANLKASIGGEGGAAAKLVQQGDIDTAYDQAALYLKGQKDVSRDYWFGDDPTKLAKASHQLVGEWLGEIRGGRLNSFEWPFDKWLKATKGK